MLEIAIPGEIDSPVAPAAPEGMQRPAVRSHNDKVLISFLERLLGSICFRYNLSRFGFEHWRRGSHRRSLIPLAFQATLQSGLCGVKP